MACRSGMMALRVALAAALVALAAPAATPAPPSDAFEAAFQGRCGSGSPCEQLCRELHDGTFECGCSQGYLLKVDGYGCMQLNATNAEPTADTAEDVLYSKDVSFSAELEVAPSSKLSNINTHIETTTTKHEKHISKVESSAERSKELEGLASLIEDGISKVDLNMISEDIDEVEGRVTTQGPSLEQKVPGATNPPPWTAAVERCDCSSCDNRCPCPNSCKHSQPISTPRFSGSSWLALRALRGAYKKVRIRIRVRPERARGVLLLTGEHDDLSGDYLALMLRQGHVELRFDCGSGAGILRSPEPVRLGRWNTVSVYRHRWDAWLRLNNGKRVRGRSKGLFSRMTFREPVWVGGAGNTTGLQAKLGLSEGLLGCVDYLRINGDTYGLVRGAVATSDIAECAPTLAPWKPHSEQTTSETTPDLSHNDIHAIYDINDIVHFEDNDLVMRDASPKKEDDKNELDNSIEQFKNAIKISNYVPKIVEDQKIRPRPDRANPKVTDLSNISKKGVDLSPMQEKCECQHGGGCVGGVCLCPLGYAGVRCEITLDLKVPRFNGSSYLRLPGLGNSAQSWLNIQITIKPSSGDGLVLYDADREDGDGDFFSLHLRRYYVEFAFDLGSGIALVRSAYPLKQNKWHRVVVNRSGRRATLTVKSIDSLNAGDKMNLDTTRSVKSRGSARKLSLARALLLGGAPEPLPPRLALTASLSGCVGQLTINDEEISVVAAALGGVNVDNCEEPHDDVCTDVNLCKEALPPLPLYPENLTEADIHHSIVPKKGFVPKHKKYKTKHLTKSKKKFVEQKIIELQKNELQMNKDKTNELQMDEGRTEGPVYDGRTYMQVKYLDANEINWGDTNTYPSFSGQDSFIHIDDEETMKRLLSYTLDINIRFRCSRSHGLLVWSGGVSPNTDDDFLSLGVEDSALVFRYNLGSGEVVIVANHTKVDDGLWHRARATRNRQAGVLEVDGLGSVGKISPGKLKQLNTDNGLYIGGLPSIEINSMGKYKTGLIGCVSQISLSGDFDIPLSLSKLPHTITNNVGRCAPFWFDILEYRDQIILNTPHISK